MIYRVALLPVPNAPFGSACMSRAGGFSLLCSDEMWLHKCAVRHPNKSQQAVEAGKEELEKEPFKVLGVFNVS